MYYNNNPGNWIGLFLNVYKKKGADVMSAPYDYKKIL